MSKVFLQDAKAYLVSFDMFKRSEERLPAIIIHADLSNIETTKSYQEDSVWQLQTSFIHEISPASEDVDNPMMNTFFHVGENVIALRIPVQFLSLAFSLSRDNDIGNCPMFLVDSNTTPIINPTKTYTFADVNCLLSFPPSNVELHDEFTEVLKTSVTSALTQQASLIPLAEVYSDFRDAEKDLIVEEILGVSLNAILSLIRDDISPLMNIPELIEYKRLDEEHETAPLPTYFNLLATVMSYIHDLSPVNKPIYNVDMGDRKRLSSFGNAEFTRLISPINDEIKSESHKNIKSSESLLNDAEYLKWKNAVDTWNIPIQDSWPEEMNGVKEYLESVDLFESILDVASYSLAEADKQVEFLVKYGPAVTLLGVYVRIAIFVYKEIEKLKLLVGETESPSDIAIAWFSLIDSKNWWELPSTNEDLANFNIKNASTIIQFGMLQTEETLQAPYFLAMLKLMGIFMFTDDDLSEYTHEDWVQAFESLENTTEDFVGMKEFFLNFFDAMDEIIEEAYPDEDEEVDYEDVAENALNAVLNPSMSFSKVADYTVLMIPVVAEIKASLDEEKFSETWDIERKRHINMILLEFAEEIGRRVSINGI